MLNTFRNSAHGIVAKILLGLLCLSFAIWGIDDMFRNPDRNKTIARVGGTNISTEQFNRSMHSETENIRRLMGDNYNPESVKHMDVEGYVLQNLINHQLLKLETVNLGLIPSDVDVVRRIRSNTSFQDSKGNFDKAIFESMLRNTNMSEKIYVDQLREDMAITLLLETLANGVPSSDLAASTLLHAREEGRQITLYSLSDSAVANTTPDDAALKTYYDSHPTAFSAPEFRDISYVTLTSESAPANAAADEATLRAAYNDRIDDYKHPERRMVEQLLYSSEAQAKKAAELLKTGKSIADVAAQIEPLNKKSLAMGKIERHNIFDNASEAVFSLPAGANSDPIQSPFGWHIFHVTSIEPPTTAPFEEVRPALEKDLAQQNKDEGLSKLANKIEDALAGGSSLAEVAKEHNLKVATIGPVSAGGKKPDGSVRKDIPALDKFLETAFKTEEKSESPVMTAKGGVFYILRVDSVTPEHLRPLEEVRAEVLAAWQKEARAKQLAEIAKKAGEEFAGAGAKTALVAKYKMSALGKSVIKRSTHVAKDVSLPPQLVADIFSRPQGNGTRAYLTTNGVYLLAVAEEVVPVGSIEKDPKLAGSLVEIKRSLQSVMQNEIIDEYTEYLGKKYSVKIYNDVFQQLVSN